MSSRPKPKKRDFYLPLFPPISWGERGEWEKVGEKNLSEMAKNAIGVVYHRLHHFLTDAQWSAQAVNERRLQVMNQCRQTKIQKGFSLIVDDSLPRKSGNFTAGVGRQYLGEIGKTDNGIVMVTTQALLVFLLMINNFFSLDIRVGDPQDLWQ